jgi:hypothetical protein
MSFAYFSKTERLKALEKKLGEDFVIDYLLLDSGAYTAFTQGKKIDLREYAEFINELRKHPMIGNFAGAITLDEIPAKPGTRVTNKELNSTAQKSFENTEKLKELVSGVPILPVYHAGERFKFLELYEDYGYLAFSLTSERRSKDWAEDVFEIAAKLGWDDKRIHGLGHSSPTIVSTLPYHSVDVSSAVICAANGRLMLPKMRADGSVNWDHMETVRAGKQLLKGDFSRDHKTSQSVSKMPSFYKAEGIEVKVGATDHIVSIMNNPVAEKALLGYLNHWGFEYNDLFVYEHRVALNAIYLMEYQKHTESVSFRKKAKVARFFIEGETRLAQKRTSSLLRE